MDLRKAIFVICVNMVSISALNYLLVFIIPEYAAEYGERGQHLPAASLFFLSIIHFIKVLPLLGICIFIIPFIFCFRVVSGRMGDFCSWAAILLFYLIPITCLYLPPAIGLPGSAIQKVLDPSAEELASVPLWSPMPTTRSDFVAEGMDARQIVDEICLQYDLVLVDCVRLPEYEMHLRFRDVTASQMLEVLLEPLGCTFYKRSEGITVLTNAGLLDMDTTALAIPILDDYGTIAASISPLIDPVGGGAVYHDKIRNALIIYERPSRISKIVEIVDRLQGVKPVAEL